MHITDVWVLFLWPVQYINTFVDRITIFWVNLDESTAYCMWTDTPVKSTFTYSREADTTFKIAGIADKMIHKHDGHAMISMINVLSSKT